MSRWREAFLALRNGVDPQVVLRTLKQGFDTYDPCDTWQKSSESGVKTSCDTLRHIESSPVPSVTSVATDFDSNTPGIPPSVTSVTTVKGVYLDFETRNTGGRTLENKCAVVFGAGGSIGAAVAKEFAAEGARVFLAGRTKARANHSGRRRSAGGCGRRP